MRAYDAKSYFAMRLVGGAELLKFRPDRDRFESRILYSLLKTVRLSFFFFFCCVYHITYVLLLFLVSLRDWVKRKEIRR